MRKHNYCLSCGVALSEDDFNGFCKQCAMEWLAETIKIRRSTGADKSEKPSDETVRCKRCNEPIKMGPFDSWVHVDGVLDCEHYAEK